MTDDIPNGTPSAFPAATAERLHTLDAAATAAPWERDNRYVKAREDFEDGTHDSLFHDVASCFGAEDAALIVALRNAYAEGDVLELREVPSRATVKCGEQTVDGTWEDTGDGFFTFHAAGDLIPREQVEGCRGYEWLCGDCVGCSDPAHGEFSNGYRDMAEHQREQVEGLVVALRAITAVADFEVDPDDCWFDHNGDCQAHGLGDMGDRDVPHCPTAALKEEIAASKAALAAFEKEAS